MIRCTRCEVEFTEDEIKGFATCPNCKTKSIPCDSNNEVTITINTHELRVLLVWAENYAADIDNNKLDDAYHEPLKPLVGIIAKRIRKQLAPDKAEFVKTLSEEFKELKEVFGEARFYRNGHEEL